MDNLELMLAQALCDSGGSRHNPCRYHIAGAKAVLNALAGAGMVVVPQVAAATDINALAMRLSQLPVVDRPEAIARELRERDAEIARLRGIVGDLNRENLLRDVQATGCAMELAEARVELDRLRAPPGADVAALAERVTNDYVNHPAHYGGGENPYEAIKVIEAWALGFCLGNTVKYISRAGVKGDRLTDLRKAAWYLNREIADTEKINV